jgi:hypothetical protein
VADTLRANSNDVSNQYFLPIMGLVFLRHAYSRYLAVKDAIEANLPTRGGKARPTDQGGFPPEQRHLSAPYAHLLMAAAKTGLPPFEPTEELCILISKSVKPRLLTFCEAIRIDTQARKSSFRQ